MSGLIKSLKIVNFRSIRSQKLKLAPITVVYGHNSTGKSSLLYSLFVMRNIVLNPNQQPLAFFNLTFANLGDFQNVVFDHKERNFIEFEIETERNYTKLKYGISVRKNEGKFALRVDGKIKAELKVSITFPYPLNQ